MKRISKEKIARIIRVHSAYRAAQGIDDGWMPSEVVLRDAVTVLRWELAPATSFLLFSRNIRHFKLLPEPNIRKLDREDRETVELGRKVFELLTKLEKVAEDMGIRLPKWSNRQFTESALFKRTNPITMTDEEFLRQVGISRYVM